MTRFGLTATQRLLLDFVQAELSAGKVPPSFEQIRDHLGLRSKSGVHRLVKALVERGWLVRLPNRARSLALPGSGAAREAELLARPSLQVEISPVMARRLAMFCEDRHLAATDVVRQALDAHLRWSA